MFQTMRFIMQLDYSVIKVFRLIKEIFSKNNNTQVRDEQIQSHILERGFQGASCWPVPLQ